jgi:hypothetical protein
MTEDSYIMSNSTGGKSLITKSELDDVTCLKKEKEKLEKKFIENEDYLMRILKNELMREKKIQKVKDKINEKDKKIKKFLKNRNENLKILENERYQDNQDINERQKIYEKMISNYNQKVEITKKNKSQNKDKMLEFKRQINDYERKNKEYKDKITEMFDLKDIEEKNQKEIKKNDLTNPNSGRNKYMDMEEKLEIERYRRESALMNNMNKFQKKINGYLEKNEEKEKKIKKVIEKVEKDRNEKRMLKSIHFEEVREKIKDKQKKYENERKKKIENLEKKDLKDFAINQEKIKLYEERKKINQMNNEEREAMKVKIKEILNKKENLNKVEDNEKLINNILYNDN